MAPDKKQKQPLWTRVLRDKASRAWLKQHANEFPTQSFVPDDIAFKDKASSAQQFIAEIFTELLPKLKGDDRKVVKLYLQTHPSRMADALGWERKDVYLAIRRLKRQALRAWKASRDDATLERAGKLDLDAPPERVAIRTLCFRLHGKERRAFLVSRDDLEQWVDEAGALFAEEVQEILHALPEFSPGFSVVDVETEG
jgi:hypothetical protein